MTDIYDEGMSYQGATTTAYKPDYGDMAKNAGATGVTTLVTTGNPWAAIGVTLLSFGLQAATAPKQRREWTGQDALLHDLKKEYTEIRESRENAIKVASSISGKPIESYTGLRGFYATRQAKSDTAMTPQEVVKETQEGIYAIKHPYNKQGQLTPERIKEQKKQVEVKRNWKQDLKNEVVPQTTSQIKKKKKEAKQYEEYSGAKFPRKPEYK